MAVPTLAVAAGVVVVDLDDAVLHAHRVVGAALVERGEHTVAAANDRAGVGLPGEADAWLNAVGYVLDGGAVVWSRAAQVGVVLDRRGGELDVVAHAGSKSEVRSGSSRCPRRSRRTSSSRSRRAPALASRC